MFRNILLLFAVLNSFHSLMSQEIIEVVFRNGEIYQEQISKKQLKYSADSIHLFIKNESRYYSPAEIQGIKTKNLNLYSDSVLTRDKGLSLHFIEPLVKGNMSLYQSYDKRGKRIFYLQKKDSLIHQIPEKFYKGYIHLMFADCRSLNLEMNDKSLDRFQYKLSNWIELVMYYNECQGEALNTTIYREPAYKFRNYLTAGISTSAFGMNVPPYNKETISLGYSPLAGIVTGIEYFNFFGFFAAANFRHYGGKGEFITTGRRLVELPDYTKAIIEVDVDVDLKYSMYVLELPLYMKANLFPSGKISPYIEFGPMINSIFINKSRALAIDNYIIPGTYDDKIYFNEFNVGVYLNAGLGFQWMNRNFALNFTYTNLNYKSQPIYNYGLSNDDAITRINNYAVSLRMRL